MSERELAEICAGLKSGIECNTESVELNNEFDLVREVMVDQHGEICSDGLCSLNWKPDRNSAA